MSRYRITADELQEDREALEADRNWETSVSSWLVDALAAYMVDPSPERLRDLRRMDYRRVYLRTPEWRAKRDAAIACASDRCARCGSRGLLDVHHLTYERLGAEFGTDLLVLCRPCHRQEHRWGR